MRKYMLDLHGGRTHRPAAGRAGREPALYTSARTEGVMTIPMFDGINIVVADMSAAVDFYQRLGI